MVAVAVALFAPAASLSCARQNPERALSGEEASVAALNADIVSIVSGGEWQGDGRNGFYRLVVVSGGYEHVTSRLYVQWVQESQDSSTPSRVVHTKNVFGDSLYSLGVQTISLVQRSWQATVDGSDGHGQPPRPGQWVLALGPPGETQVREIR